MARVTVRVRFTARARVVVVRVMHIVMVGVSCVNSYGKCYC